MKQSPWIQIVKLGVILSTYCIIAAIALSITYSYTLPLIQAQQKKITQESMKTVYSNATEFILLQDEKGDPYFSAQEIVPGILIDGIYQAQNSTGETLGLIVKASSVGYGGPILFVYGINPDDTLQSVSIIEQTETPGLGANVIKNNFLDQFQNKSIQDNFLVKQDIQPITASTITSRALTAGVKESLNFIISHLEEIQYEK